MKWKELAVKGKSIWKNKNWQLRVSPDKQNEWWKVEELAIKGKPK